MAHHADPAIGPRESVAEEMSLAREKERTAGIIQFHDLSCGRDPGVRKSTMLLENRPCGALKPNKTGANMTRNVVQIAADPSYLYALCDDGEIFRLVNHVWQPMAPIPQGDPRQARPGHSALAVA